LIVAYEWGANRTVRVTVDVGGYQWRIHGAPDRNWWVCHLVELLGSCKLDVPIDKRLREKLREKLARQLDLAVDEIKPISADLILT